MVRKSPEPSTIFEFLSRSDIRVSKRNAWKGRFGTRWGQQTGPDAAASWSKLGLRWQSASGDTALGGAKRRGVGCCIVARWTHALTIAVGLGNALTQSLGLILVGAMGLCGVNEYGITRFNREPKGATRSAAGTF